VWSVLGGKSIFRAEGHNRKDSWVKFIYGEAPSLLSKVCHCSVGGTVLQSCSY
jgi:hypothetical protein